MPALVPAFEALLESVLVPLAAGLVPAFGAAVLADVFEVFEVFGVVFARLATAGAFVVFALVVVDFGLATLPVLVAAAFLVVDAAFVVEVEAAFLGAWVRFFVSAILSGNKDLLACFSPSCSC